jgi:hypothetical protein
MARKMIKIGYGLRPIAGATFTKANVYEVISVKNTTDHLPGEQANQGGGRPHVRARLVGSDTRATQGRGAELMVKIDHVQRVILENQIVMAEAMWMVLYAQGTKPRMLENISARIATSRQLIEEADEDRMTAHEVPNGSGLLHPHPR